MPNYSRTVTVQLTPEEAAKILRDALQLSPEAKVEFVIGAVASDPMGRWETMGMTGVKFTYIEGGVGSKNFGGHAGFDR